jgi:hypothetical protein
MNPMNAPVFEGVAREGKGVFATLKEISRLVIERLNKEHAPAANRRRTQTSVTPPAPINQVPSQPPQPPVQTAPPLHQHTPYQPPAQLLPSMHANTPLAQARLQQRPAAMPTHTPARPLPSAPPPVSPTPGAMPIPAENPRDKHLAKAKPPALDRAQAQRVNLGSTDPSLKRYQETQRPDNSGVKVLLMILIGLIVLIIVSVLLVMYVPETHPFLPASLQKIFAPPEMLPAPASPVAPTMVPAPPTPSAIPTPPAAAPASAPTANAPVAPPAAAAAAQPAPPGATAQPAAPPAAEGAHGK